MSLTDIEICSNALIRLGAIPIQSFDDKTDIATACKNIYGPKKKYMLSFYPWRFSMKFSQLSRDLETPVAHWKYQYTLPSDKIQAGFPEVYTSNNINSYTIDDWEIIGNKLMTNEPEIWVKYQFNINEELWPEYFTELMIKVMQVELCQIVTDNTTLFQELKYEVYGTPTQNGLGGIVNTTMYLDSRDTPSVYIKDFSLTDARYSNINT